MASINNPEFRAHNNALSPDGHRGMRTANEQQTSPTLVAYVFIMPKEADLTLETIRNLMPQGIFTSVIGLPMAQEAKASTDDSWLQHPAAAEYLGISESTLSWPVGRPRPIPRFSDSCSRRPTTCADCET